jgi:hypothetical protein
MPITDRGIITLGIMGLTSGSMIVTDIGPDNTPLETGIRARADYYTGTISWAKKISEGLAAGVTVKGVYNYLSDGIDHWSADGVVFDAGAQYRGWNSRLIYGFAVQNIGFLRSGYSGDDTYPLPSAVELGVSYIPKYISSMRLSLDLNKKANDYLLFEPGAEVELLKNQLMLRGGYAVSWRDLDAFIANLKGESDKSYYRSDRAALCLGMGVLTEFIDRLVRLDAALEFSDFQVVPALVVSLYTDL